MPGPTELVLVALPFAFIVYLLVGLKRTGDDLEPEEWASAHGVTLTSESRSMVTDYLERSRRFRLIGALVGIVVPFGLEVPGIEMIGGYLVGALAAEFTQNRLPKTGERSASLSPRQMSDYLPAWIPNALRVLGVAGPLLVTLFLFGPERTGQPMDAPTEVIVFAGVATMVVAFAIEFLLRRMAERAQPAASHDSIKVDDAIRSASMHAAAGAGMGVTLLSLAGLLWVVGVTSDIQLLRWTFPFLAAGSGFAAVAMWIALGPGTPWRVRRNVSPSGAVT